MATKAELRQVVEEFNKVMALDPAIKTNSKRTLAQMESDIREAAGELRDDDEFSDDVERVLVELGIRESHELESETEESGEPQTAEIEGGGKGKTEQTKSAQKKRYSRFDSVFDVLRSHKGDGLMDKEVCGEKANALYAKKGGKENLGETMWVVHMVYRVIEFYESSDIKFS